MASCRSRGRGGGTASGAALGGRTVIRGGYGLYYSTGQNDDVTAAIDSLANRGELLTAASYPIALFNRIFVNTIDPVTRTRQAAPFVTTQIDRKSALGHTRFDGLQLGLQRRFSGGYLLSASYMLGDSTDNNAGNGEGSEGMIAGCGACEQGPSDFDVRHSFSGTFVYELPWGSGRRVAVDGLVDVVLGGWNLAGVLIARGGRPFSVLVNRTAPDGNDVNQRANMVSGVEPMPGDAPNSWLDIGAFAIPATTEFGNSPRNGFRGPGLWQIDLSVNKRTPLAGATALEFRVDVFNVLNQPQYGLPARNRSEPLTFGILAPANDGPTGTGTSRQFQFSARLSF